MRNLNLKSLVIEAIVPPILLSVVMFTFYSTILNAEFAQKDEWVHVGFALPEARNHPDLPGVADRLNTLEGIVARDLSVGRIRPGYYLTVVTRAEIIGLNPGLLHLQSLLVGIATAFFGFIALRRLNIAWYAAMLGATALLLITNGDTWWQTMIAETPGLFFSLLSLLFLIEAARRSNSKALEFCAFAAMVFAGLCKETFAVLIPAQAAFYVALNYSFGERRVITAFRRSALFLTLSVAVFAALSYLILTTYFGGGYGAGVVNRSGTTLREFARALYENVGIKLIMFAPVLIWFGIIVRQRKFHGVHVLGYGAVLSIWILPQLFIYRNAPDFHHHYAYPLVVALIALQAYGLSELWKWNNILRGTSLILSLIWAAVLLQSGRDISQFASRFAAESRVVYEITTRAAEITADTKPVVFLSPARKATVTYVLQQYGLNDVLLPAFFDYGGASGKQAARLVELQRERYNYDRETAQAKDFGAVTVITAKEPDYPPWFDHEAWTPQPYVEPIYRYGLFGYDIVGEVAYKIFLPNE
jgi:hypothetical protein